MSIKSIWQSYKFEAQGKSAYRFFGKWCDFVFRASQAFLCLLNRWGGNYVLNSVVICVVIPILNYIILLIM